MFTVRVDVAVDLVGLARLVAALVAIVIAFH